MKKCIIASILCVILSACGQFQLFSTSKPTLTLTPTVTSTDTLTPTPTSTNTPTRTPTPTPIVLSKDNVENIQFLKFIGDGQPRNVLFTNDGKRIIVSLTHSIVVYDQSYKEITKITSILRLGRISLHPNNKWVAAGVIDEKEPKVVVWDIETGQQVKSLDEQAAVCPYVLFSDSGNLLGATCWESGLILWDTSNWNLIPNTKKNQYYQPDEAPIYLSDDGKLVFTQKRQKLPTSMVMHHQERNAPALYQFDGYLTSLFLSQDRKNIVAGTDDGYVSLWKLPDLNSLSGRWPLALIKAKSWKVGCDSKSTPVRGLCPIKVAGNSDLSFLYIIFKEDYRESFQIGAFDTQSGKFRWLMQIDDLPGGVFISSKNDILVLDFTYRVNSIHFIDASSGNRITEIEYGLKICNTFLYYNSNFKQEFWGKTSQTYANCTRDECTISFGSMVFGPEFSDPRITKGNEFKLSDSGVSPDGNYLTMVIYNKEISEIKYLLFHKPLDIKDAIILREIPFHNQVDEYVPWGNPVYSQDSKLVSIEAGKHILTWNTQNGQLVSDTAPDWVKELDKGSFYFYGDFDYMMDNTLVAIDVKFLYFINPLDGTILHSVRTILPNSTGRIALSPDGSQLAVLSCEGGYPYGDDGPGNQGVELWGITR
ncbi:MAG: hypothetical protein LUQ65_15435 [Candidatus Helarchaeota archaeon]|nr:hypothetical protein [Candidatus Helarchaeota archaeon]